jgi:hypothetical protein
MLKWSVMAAMGVLLTGCAALAPVAANIKPSSSAKEEFHSATSIKLEQANFAVVKTNVVGECKGFALLGLVTVVPAEFSTAMDRLYVRAEMQPGRAQTLGNTLIERSSTYLILFSIPKVSVRADVLEFVPASPTGPPLGRRD